MKWTINICRGVLISVIIIMISSGCAQQGAGSLVGGEKDEAPPMVLESTPENYKTNFDGWDYEFVFDEYFVLKELNQKLLISPPMDNKPEIKVKGKKLQIHFLDSLLPDRTYTLNFGDALVDLNESNPYENFTVIFSTGNEIDSLELKGKITDAFTGKPVQGVSVMLYSNTNDSVPLTEIPLYLSRTNEAGQYHLKNLASGHYKLFALLDGNNNYLFDQPKEAIAFLDTLISGKIPPIREQLTGNGEPTDSLPTDSLPPGISEDTLGYEKDTLPPGIRGDQGGYATETDSLTQSTDPPISDSLYLRLFIEAPPKQYIAGTERKRGDKVQILFFQELDSLSLNLMYTDSGTEGYGLQWSATKDTVICWMTDSLLSMRDSLFFITSYLGYDSIEQREWITDTLRFNFKHSAAKKEETNPMSLKSSVAKTMELGIPFKITTGLPYMAIDTSMIHLFRVRDSLEFPEDFDIVPQIHPSPIPGTENIAALNTAAIISKEFLQDSSYSLRILPGAFTGFMGTSNDSLNIDFTVSNAENYGTVKMTVENLDEPAILQLLNNKEEVFAEKAINSDEPVSFPLLKPGKYGFKLILDKNNNGKWDTGRYLKNIQPEPIIFYNKEITLKANWEMEETWPLKLN